MKLQGTSLGINGGTGSGSDPSSHPPPCSRVAPVIALLSLFWKGVGPG